MSISEESRVHLALLFSLFVVTACGSDEPPAAVDTPEPAAAMEVPPGGYKLDVSAQSDGSIVTLKVTTNIPGTIELFAGLDLKGQAPDDVYIGADSQRIRLENGRPVTVKFDTSDLPQGTYEATADFYPRWGFQDELSKSTGITANISAAVDIDISGSGESAADALARENSQKWVMETFEMGQPWVESEWTSRFGSYESIPVEGLNPDIIHAYYFPKLDMTIFVNDLKGTASHWRVGRASR